MQSLSNFWHWMGAHIWTILIVLGVLIAIAAIVLLVLWLRKRKAPPAGGKTPLDKNKLINLRDQFFKALPFRYRATVREFPTLVVLGPAGSGKSTLIDGELDWRRQANQFMPSLTTDSILQIYLGADSVVQEVSSPLLEDDSPEARTALIKLWKETFKVHDPMVVIALDALWLTQTPPDEIRRVTQLLRGKINLLSEIVRQPVETRLCLTHADQIEGFTDFARLLRDNGVPLSFDLPKRGEEAKIAQGLQEYEKYLALALTSLAVDAFDRLEGFFTRGGEVFAALARFAKQLVEGGSMAQPPKLANLYLFSPLPEARSVDIFQLPEAIEKAELSPRYRKNHLRRAIAITAAGTLPLFALYANMYFRVNNAHDVVQKYREHVATVVSKGDADRCGDETQADREAALKAILEIRGSTKFWPPLQSSFLKTRVEERLMMAEAIRECHLMPLLARCQRIEKSGQYEGPFCSQEQTLYLLAVMYASRESDLGRYILAVEGQNKENTLSSLSPIVEDVLERQAEISFANLDALAEAIGLNRDIIATYVGASDSEFKSNLRDSFDDYLKRVLRTKEPRYTFMPFENKLFDELMRDWLAHFDKADRLVRVDGDAGEASGVADDDMEEDGADGGGGRRVAARERRNMTASSSAEGGGGEADRAESNRWKALVEHGKPLEVALKKARPFRQIADVRRLLDNSHPGGINTNDIVGITGRIEMLDWLNNNYASLDGLFQLERQADNRYHEAESWTFSDLLTRADGLFPVGNANTRYSFLVTGHPPYNFEPQAISKTLLEKLIESWQESGRLAFLRKQQTEEEAKDKESRAKESLAADCRGITWQKQRFPPVMERATFDSQVKPSLQDFTRLMAQTKLTGEDVAARKDYVLQEAEKFALQYRAGLLCTFHADYTFSPGLRTATSEFDGKDKTRLDYLETRVVHDLVDLAKPANPLADMLRKVAQRADLGTLEGVYFDPMRNAVAPFKSIVRLMTPDKDGLYPELNKYLAIVGQFAIAAEQAASAADEAEGGDKAGGDKGDKAAGDKAGGDKGGDAKAEAGGEKAGGDKGDKNGKQAAAEQRLMDKLSPLARVAMPILLNQDNSFLRKVDAWLDAANVLGEFREPFRTPFLLAAGVGRREVEMVVAREWRREFNQVVRPLLQKYPFDPRSDQNVDPPELDVLRKKDGRFWQFVDRVISPVIDRDGSRFTPRKIIANEFELPSDLIPVLNRFARVSDLLWDEAGNRKPLALQVRPLKLDDKLPGAGVDKKTPLGDDAPGGKTEDDNQIYVTMGYLKAGSAVCYAYNQQPSWQDFPLQWWNQETASVGIQLTSPDRDGRQYRSVDVAQGWSFYRLLAMATRSENNEYSWVIRTGNLAAELAGLTQKKQQRVVSFAIRGDPWAPFRSYQ